MFWGIPFKRFGVPLIWGAPQTPTSATIGSGEKLLAHERASAGAVRAKLFEQMETERNQLVAQAKLVWQVCLVGKILMNMIYKK